MLTKFARALVAFGLLLAISVAAGPPPPAPVGPPWISLELPANPLDPETRDAALVVHAYHHGSPAGYPISGRAEGLVNGERRSVSLEFTATARPGVYALTQQWPAEGDWVLAIAVGEDADASLFVELGPDGGVSEGKFYNVTTRAISARSIRVIAGTIANREIESSLRRMAASD